MTLLLHTLTSVGLNNCSLWSSQEEVC